MGRAIRIVVFVFAAMAIAASALAAGPRQQLDVLVLQLKNNPGDQALREKIIALAREVKPAPVPPEEANRALIRGNVFQREAKNPGGYDLAIAAYQEALTFAPWWADAYFNLSVAQESAGKFDDAVVSLKRFVLAAPTDKEAREARNKIYALEAKKELAGKHRAEQAEVDRKKTLEFANDLAGDWETRDDDISTVELYRVDIADGGKIAIRWVKTRKGYEMYLPFEETYNGLIEGRRVSGSAYMLSNFTTHGCGIVRRNGSFEGTASEDGKTITLRAKLEGTSCSHTSSATSYSRTLQKAR